MPHRLIGPSLRRSLILSATLMVVVVTLAMIMAFSTTFALRNELDRDTNAFIEEQRIADQIVALTYAQQLEAYRFLQAPGASRRARFQSLGDQADSQMRRYLFHELSPSARLQVERMKEIHQALEVTAQRAFDLAERGETSTARARVAALDAQAATLDTAVTRFLGERVAQRSALQERYRALTNQVRIGLGLVGLLLLALLTVVARHQRRRVVKPLEQLTAAAERIRGGDTSARVPAQHYEELKLVATAFNEMADSMQLARETVEMQNEELRQSLDQLQESQSELAQHEKLSALGQMLAGLAHELNNPLSGVLGMSELLRAELSSSPDPAARQLDEEIGEPLEREAIRARDLVRNLLSFARKATGTVEPVALHAAISTAVALRAYAFVQAGRRLELDVPAPFHVFADIQKLQHAVVNVVNNALDAIVSGEGTRLRITAVPEGDDIVRVDFEDDGPGFRDPSAVFAAFYTTKPAERGTGLGLTLVQQFVEEFGGSVSADNPPEGGARLTMRLRRADVPRNTPEPHAATRTVARKSGQASGDPRTAWGARPPRVLVVDDELSLREVQRRLLQLEGIEVVVASTGDEARQILAREPVDLVVSDLRMPGDSDGLGLLAWLEHAHPRLARTALLVTGDVSSGVRASVVPAERRLSKPFTREEYVSRIRAALLDWQK
jgi:signal transduction histidine kinase